MSRLLFLSVFLFATFLIYGQKSKSEPFSFHAGYGLAGSFFVRSYVENEVPWETSFFKKKFIGKNMSVGVTKGIGKHLELSFNYSYQEFNRKIDYRVQIDNVLFVLDQHAIHHINHIYDLTVRRRFQHRSASFAPGLGIYYLRPIQQEIAIDRFTNLTVIEVQDRNQSRHRLNEGGVLAEFLYEKRFQPRVSIGINAQFYYTLSAGYSESITLFPFLKIYL